MIGQQWWWEFSYDALQRAAAGLHHRQRTARAGQRATRSRRPVYLTLESADVCHSFWVPRLAGKTDLIPGVTNHMWFRPNEPGCSWGNAPNIAARSTPACCCGWWSTRPRCSSAGWPTKRQPAAEEPGRAAGQGRLPGRIVRQLPSRARNVGPRVVRPRSDPPDEPADAGVRAGAERSARICAAGFRIRSRSSPAA